MTTHDELLGRASVVATRSTLARTRIIASLDDDTDPAVDVVWAVARLLAYEADAASLGGVRTSHDPVVFVGLHGERPAFGALDPRSFIACVGLGVGGIRRVILDALDQRFQGAASPLLVPATVARAETESYAYVWKSLMRVPPRSWSDGRRTVTEIARDERGDRCLVVRGITPDESLSRILDEVARLRPSEPSRDDAIALDADVRWDFGRVKMRVRWKVDAKRVSLLAESSVLATIDDTPMLASSPARPSATAIAICTQAGAPYAAARFVHGELLGH